MRRAALIAVLVLTVLAAGRAAAPGSAWGSEYGLPVLLSRPSLAEQPLGPATEPAITPDGRYVVFKSIGANAIRNPPASVGLPVAGAIYRLDRVTGEFAIVAYVFGDNPFSSIGADGPSISADGRYVLFTSDKLRPSDPLDYTRDARRVYIRDMSRPADDPQAYQEVDVLPGQSGPTQSPGFSAPPGTALSEDGRRLIFRDAQRGRIYWRDLDRGVTRVVSVRYDPVSGAMTDSPEDRPQAPVKGVVLSGDGTTVAWFGVSTDVVRHQPGETATATAGVLWRRIADGDRALIHQLSGPVDLDDPACLPDTPVVPDPKLPPGPCDNTQLDYGAAFAPQYVEAQLLSISRDGRTVAFLAQGHARGLNVPRVQDAYVTTVFPHQPRKKAIQPLTRGVPLSENDPYGRNSAAVNGPVMGIALSPEGRYVALVTARTVFALNPPSMIGTPPPGVGAQELYLIDRVANTLQLLTRTPSGAKQNVGPPVNGLPGIGTWAYVALADNASVAVFSSDADNLAPGDANQFRDVFSVARLPAGGGSGLTGPEIERLPAIDGRLEPLPDWALRVTSRTVAGGAVALDVTVPANGAVRAVATPAAGGAALATAAAPATAAQKITLTLRAPARERAGPAQRVAATATVSFTPADPAAGAPLRQAVGVVLVRPARAAKARRRHKGSVRRRLRPRHAWRRLTATSGAAR